MSIEIIQYTIYVYVICLPITLSLSLYVCMYIYHIYMYNHLSTLVRVDGALQLSLYRILFHFKALLWESFIRLGVNPWPQEYE